MTPLTVKHYTRARLLQSTSSPPQSALVSPIGNIRSFEHSSLGVSEIQVKHPYYLLFAFPTHTLP